MKAPKRFILVDDDPISNLICAHIIKSQFPNSEVTSFTDPSIALKSIADEYETSEFVEPCVLFVDLNMPVLTGWEFIESFKKLDSQFQQNFSVFILSSSIDERDKRKAADDPVIQGFISKPLSKQDLVGLENPQVEAVLRKS